MTKQVHFVDTERGSIKGTALSTTSARDRLCVQKKVAHRNL